MLQRGKPTVTTTAKPETFHGIGQGMRGRVRAVALAAAGVVLAALAGPLPAADAAPARVDAAVQGESPLIGAGLTVDLNAALDLEGKGIAVSGVGGAVKDEDGIALKVGKGSKIVYPRKVTGGKVLLVGGIQLSKGGKKIVISNVVVGITTGVVTAKVGAKAGVRLGTVNEPRHAEAIKLEGTTILTLKLAERGIRLGADVLSAIGTALGTPLDIDEDVDVDADLDADVDLALGNKVNTSLVNALGLGDEIDPNLDLNALRDLDFNLDIDF
ncbi:hypothetical protein [Amycolatopsis sp. NPDC049868]|uniref:hypothetical protein n=1 Tax=Amycolatopsis sp. NPDC049868 TaxID=3363934 RepID=UPI0037B1981C